jgi:carbon storage regulator
VDVRGDKVRVGINAPRQVSVHRKEVYEAIRRENENGGNGNKRSEGNADNAGEGRRKAQG